MKKIIKIIIALAIVGVAIFVILKIPKMNESQVITNEISSNNIVDEIENTIDNSIEAEEQVAIVEAEEVQENKIVNENEISSYQTGNKSCKATYYLKVNYGQNVVTVYTKDEAGNYVIPLKPMLCSCGTATPKGGIYKTSKGYAWGTVVGGLYAQYSTRIQGNILFHSIPYTKESKDTMEYWEYDKLGTTASAGCVRLRVEDCKWIFDNCEEGTIVEFYKSSIPSPFSKPELEKISDNVECRNWDPTDDVPENPWKKYNNE